jgi:hypothetical protein
MAPWLALTTDGMLLAALVVIWVRRHRGEHVKAGPWAAFWAGMAATIAANLAAALPTPVGLVVAMWPPVCLAITLELVALVAYPAKQHPIITHALPAELTADVADDAQSAPRHAPTVTALQDQAPKAGEARHDTPSGGHDRAGARAEEGDRKVGARLDPGRAPARDRPRRSREQRAPHRRVKSAPRATGHPPGPPVRLEPLRQRLVFCAAGALRPGRAECAHRGGDQSAEVGVEYTAEGGEQGVDASARTT